MTENRPRNWHPADLPLNEIPLKEIPEWMRPSQTPPSPSATVPTKDDAYDDEDEVYTEEDAEADRLHEIAALKELQAPTYTAAQRAAMDAAEAQYQKHKAEVIAHEEHGGPVPTMFRDRYEGLFRVFGEDRTPSGTEPHRDWLVEGLLPKAGVALLAAPPKAGKTDLATAVAYSVATGRPFAGRATEPAAVLWINGEESRAERAHLVAALPRNRRGEPAPVFESIFPLPIEAEDFRPAVESWIERTGAGLLVLDSLRTLTGLPLASPRTAQNLVARLRDLASATGAAVLVLHHTVKAERGAPGPNQAHRQFADSPALLAAAGLHLHMTWVPTTDRDGAPERRITLTAAGRGLHHGRTLLLRSSAPLDYRPEEGAARRPMAERLLALLTEGEASAVELAARLDATPRTVHNLIAALRAEGVVAPGPLRGRTRLYTLSPTVGVTSPTPNGTPNDPPPNLTNARRSHIPESHGPATAI